MVVNREQQPSPGTIRVQDSARPPASGSNRRPSPGVPMSHPARIRPDQIPTRTTGYAPLTGAPLVIHRMDLGHKSVDYRAAWQLQLDLHEQVARGNRPDTLLLLEHHRVFTAGSRTQSTDRPVDATEVVEVDRGGRITWHGPGQLVGYPIVRLPQRIDVVAYVDALESLIIGVCRDLGVATARIQGRSGVWVLPDSPGATVRANKIAAIGIRVASGVAMHGFALNCDCDLSWSEQIVPCGLSDAGVTSLTAQTGQRVSVSAAADMLQNRLCEPPDDRGQ